ncbi:MAG: PorP/SprF family type IX secretion system membrane protein [Muribaculaceae bacterium]|nr:PorP/SprF family type IX secretion system membrane protein [Muribaculaceae bacterium]
MKTAHISYKTLLCAALVALASIPGKAQIDAQFSQYWAVPAYYNPATVGNTDFIHVTAGSKAQWVGIKHAPVAFIVMGDMPFKFLNNRFGVGAVIQQESIGLYNSLNTSLQFAYKRKMLGGTMSFGVQAGLLTETFKGSKIIIPEGDEAHNSTDDAIPRNDVTGNAFDLNAGIYYQHKWFWAGLSATHVTAPTVELKTDGDSEEYYEFNAGRAYYFMAGSNIPIKNTLFELQPSVMVKTDLQFWQAEGSLRLRYNNFLSGGVGYRHNDAVSVFIGAELKNFFLGYAYDYPISSISKVSMGSHEVFLNYNVKLDLNDKNKNKHKSIRLM